MMVHLNEHAKQSRFTAEEGNGNLNRILMLVN